MQNERESDPYNNPAGVLIRSTEGVCRLRQGKEFRSVCSTIPPTYGMQCLTGPAQADVAGGQAHRAPPTFSCALVPLRVGPLRLVLTSPVEANGSVRLGLPLVFVILSGSWKRLKASWGSTGVGDEKVFQVSG